MGHPRSLDSHPQIGLWFPSRSFLFPAWALTLRKSGFCYCLGLKSGPKSPFLPITRPQSPFTSSLSANLLECFLPSFLFIFFPPFFLPSSSIWWSKACNIPTMGILRSPLPTSGLHSSVETDTRHTVQFSAAVILMEACFKCSGNRGEKKSLPAQSGKTSQRRRHWPEM